MGIRSYRDLILWQKSMDLATTIYRITEPFPAQEQFGLTSQLRRGATSIPANLAEGHSRHSRGDYRRHVSIASGSLAELETNLEIVSRLGYLAAEPLVTTLAQAGEVGRMLTVLLARLRSQFPASNH